MNDTEMKNKLIFLKSALEDLMKNEIDLTSCPARIVILISSLHSDIEYTLKENIIEKNMK